MTELLHAWALAPAAIGTCCLAADRRRVRVPELAASAVMVLAMLDVAFWGVVPAVYWAAVLVAGALALAALRRVRASRPEASAHGRIGGMTVHTTAGLVLMAALLVGMGPGGTGFAGGHQHEASALAFTAGVTLAAVAYAAASVVAAVRTGAWLDRAQYAAMGTAAVLMGVGALF